MLLRKAIGLALFVWLGCTSATTVAQAQPRGGGFYDDVYRDGGCWLAGYYQCRLHGRFDGASFSYHFAVYRGCYQYRRVETAHGVRTRRVFVCQPNQ